MHSFKGKEGKDGGKTTKYEPSPKLLSHVYLFVLVSPDRFFQVSVSVQGFCARVSLLLCKTPIFVHAN